MKLWDGWDNFLKVIASDHQLTVDQQAVFLVRFARQNIDKKNQDIADEVIGGEPANALHSYDKYMKQIFGKLSESFPEVNSEYKGKVKRVQACLEKVYLEQQQNKDSETGSAIASHDWTQICRDRLEAQQQQRLTTNPLTTGDGMKYELDDIHVPLGLVERKQRPKIRDEISPQQGVTSQYEIGKQFEYGEFVEEVLNKQRQSHATKKTRIAIIGEPGAGKTTLLQKIATWVFEPQEDTQQQVAIWVSLADLQGKTLEEYLLQTWLKQALEVVDVTPEDQNALVQFFKSDRVWLLLDGVDEMVAGLPLQAIASHLSGWVARSRVVLTCRLNVWEANFNALEIFEIYRTLEFSYSPIDQVEEFINKWFKKIDLVRGLRLRKALNESGKERIRDLVKNPLSLALLCRTWQLHEGGLPDTKAKLFQQFVDTLYLWKSKYKEFRISSAQREELNAKLGELARDAIDQQGSRFRLSESSIRQFLGDPDEEGSLFWLATKIGWLIPVGLMAENPHEKAYTFFHPTFQEYFAACAINDWDYFLNHVPQNPKDPKASYRIFEQQWKEVFLLWLGRPKKEVPDEEKEALITALVEFEDRCQEFYTYRAYFLAAASITEFGNCSRADEITLQLVKWDSCEPDEQNEELYKSFYCFEQGVKAALRETDRTKAVNAFVHLLRTNQDEFARLSIAASLGEIGAGNLQAIHALIHLLKTSQFEITSQRAGQSLRKIGAGNLVPIACGNSDAMETATYWLMHIALDEVIPRVGEWLLRQIAPGNFNLINVLISRLPAIMYEAICLQIASWFLMEIEPDNENAINILIKLLLKSQSQDIRQLAACLLGEVTFENLNAINVMSELLYTCQDEDERLGIAVNLGKINPSNPEAIAVLAELLHTCKDEKERRWIANKLGEIDFGNPEAMAALTELLHTCQDENELEFIIRSLGEIKTDNLDTIKALIELMYTGHNYRILWETAHSLELIVRGYLFGEVVSGLRECLEESVDENDFRYKPCYQLIWHCAQNMTYPDFYYSWHGQSSI